MKYLTLFFVSFSAFAQVNPVITSGEVKITYPCDILSGLSLEKEEKESISFYELSKNAVYRSGFIIRKRLNAETKEADFTVKYRTKSHSRIFDESLYQKLTDSSKGEFKCEFDVNYHATDYTPTYSCSFKSETSSYLPEHFQFIKMVNQPIPDLPSDLRKMNELKVEATSWKLKLTKSQKEESPFEKKPSVEKWLRNGKCRLEVSGKITAPNANPKTIHETAGKGFAFLKSVIKEDPSPVQGMKTEWVLGP